MWDGQGRDKRRKLGEPRAKRREEEGGGGKERKRNEESASAGYAVAACDYACGTRDSGAKASTRCT